MEKGIKVFLCIIFFLSCILLLNNINNKYTFYISLILSIIFLLFVFFESYLRIQHNIDKNNNLNKNTIIEISKQTEYIRRSLNELFEGVGQFKKEISVDFLNIDKKIESFCELISNNLISTRLLLDKNNDEMKVKIDILIKNSEEIKNEIKNLDYKTLIKNILENNEDVKVKLFDLYKNNEDLRIKIDYQKNSISRFYWSYVKDKRSENLLSLVPDIFRHKSVLYIGARPDRTDFLQNFINAEYEISILEIYKPNVEYFKNDSVFTEVIEGDVKDFKTDKKYDVIFWWHGPEHIEGDKLEDTLKKLESITEYDLVLGCPWGKVMQDNDHNDNPNEKHINFIKTGYFEKMGYKTNYSGLEDNMGSNIIAFKYLKK